MESTLALQALVGLDVGSHAVGRHHLAHSCDGHEIVGDTFRAPVHPFLLAIGIIIGTDTVRVNREERLALRAGIDSGSEAVDVGAFAVGWGEAELAGNAAAGDEVVAVTKR